MMWADELKHDPVILWKGVQTLIRIHQYLLLLEEHKITCCKTILGLQTAKLQLSFGTVWIQSAAEVACWTLICSLAVFLQCDISSCALLPVFIYFGSPKEAAATTALTRFWTYKNIQTWFSLTRGTPSSTSTYVCIQLYISVNHSNNVIEY